MNEETNFNIGMEEDKILISKVLDKFEMAKNKIQNTNFLDLRQINIVKNVLIKLKIENYILYGGYEQSERKCLIMYPEKLKDIFTNNQFDFNLIISVIDIEIPKENVMTHRDYLGGIMKTGVKREKIGDIIVRNNGADIIILKGIEKFLLDNLPSLTRFQKSIINKINIENISPVIPKTENIEVIVNSMRLDSIVSEILHCSRNKASEKIEQERVLLNFKIETKLSKAINYNDMITIRGKGRFKIGKILRTTKSGKKVVLVEKFI